MGKINFSKGQIEERITSSVRTKCAGIGINQGAIAIGFAPAVDFMAEWAGVAKDAVGLTAFPVVPGKDTLYHDTDGSTPADCAAVAAAKIFTAKAASEYYDCQAIALERYMYTSGGLPQNELIDGRTKWKGGIAFAIGYFVGGGCGHMGAHGISILVAVSGGTEEQDEEAAWAALAPIKDLFESCGYILGRGLNE